MSSWADIKGTNLSENPKSKNSTQCAALFKYHSPNHKIIGGERINVARSGMLVERNTL